VPSADAAPAAAADVGATVLTRAARA
jgi:hypothetical protein